MFDLQRAQSSLLRNFCDGVFSNDPDPTVGVDFNVRIIEVKPGVFVKLQLWDTAGQERFRSITRAYYRNSVGVLLIYDTTNYTSFTHVTNWLNEARQQIQPYQAVFLLVGTKIDRESERQVTTEEAKAFADFHDISFIETSAKSSLYVHECFVLIAKEIYDMLIDGRINVQTGWDGVKSGPKPTGYKVVGGSRLSVNELRTIFEGLIENNLINYDYILTGYMSSGELMHTIADYIRIIKQKYPNVKQLINSEIDFMNENSLIESMKRLHKIGPSQIVISKNNYSMFRIEFPKIGFYFTGVGDAFSALLLAWIHKQNELTVACEKTVSIIHKILLRTLR
ncbi:unnamed protein product [Didymodactylos carnosus]|uniref:Uncharacterized protein n=1 Tax=Didymodactylos carnosus TaxID=1234261 RepID=A0A814WDP3_9BILA|nr:unnamed protein product [Didymodactylos carnosus]CAF1201032.1 unnamed protein product [Didymodactylos carnosus]CAF3774908.1 unnamed protein product [Didymodactylos carnosus]CAF3965501.1 unnamed protein product [Didymodactylos carnosus]